MDSIRRRALEMVPASLALRLSGIPTLINRAWTLYQSGNVARESEAKGKTRRQIKFVVGIFINSRITSVINRTIAECLRLYKFIAIANSKNVQMLN